MMPLYRPEIKEIIIYAKERYIEIIPEIETCSHITIYLRLIFLKNTYEYLFKYFEKTEGAEEVLIPEKKMDLDRLLKSLKHSEKSGKSSSIIVVSEGEKIGDNVFKFSSYIEKNFPHYETRVSILGHIQRGGSPSCFDRVLASRMGVYAVDCLIENKSKIMTGIIGDKIVTVPIDDALKGGQDIDNDLVRVCDIISI